MTNPNHRILICKALLGKYPKVVVSQFSLRFQSGLDSFLKRYQVSNWSLTMIYLFLIFRWWIESFMGIRNFKVIELYSIKIFRICIAITLLYICEATFIKSGAIPHLSSANLFIANYDGSMIVISDIDSSLSSRPTTWWWWLRCQRCGSPGPAIFRVLVLRTWSIWR